MLPVGVSPFLVTSTTRGRDAGTDREVFPDRRGPKRNGRRVVVTHASGDMF